MRIHYILAAVASMAIAAPAFAQSTTNSNFSASAGTAMDNHPAMTNHTMMHQGDGQRHHALGAMRHPTVGNTANQRVNGG
jgi:hypothetical protein